MAMSRLTKAAIIFSGSPLAWLGHYVGEQLMENTARHQQAVGQGVKLGLTEDQARHVIATWHAWHRTNPEAMDWPTVERAMARRVLGEEWRP